MKKIEIKKVFYIIAVIALLIFFHFTKILNPVEKAVVFVFDPLAGQFFSLGHKIKEIYSESRANRDLSNEIKIIEKQLENLLAENARLRIIAEENKYLREYIKFFDENDYDYLLTRVVSRGFSSAISQEENMVVINKGAVDNLFPGLAVVDGNGVVIGKISAVKEKISEVILVTDPRCKLAVMTDSNDQPAGLAVGNSGLTIKMEYIPQDKIISKNDLVITSGLEEKIPAGLIVGRVTQVFKESNDVWQNATIESLAEPEGVDIAAVIIP